MSCDEVTECDVVVEGCEALAEVEESEERAESMEELRAAACWAALAEMELTTGGEIGRLAATSMVGWDRADSFRAGSWADQEPPVAGGLYPDGGFGVVLPEEVEESRAFNRSLGVRDGSELGVLYRRGRDPTGVMGVFWRGEGLAGERRLASASICAL